MALQSSRCWVDVILSKFADNRRPSNPYVLQL
jgi:hypothetical protein